MVLFLIDEIKKIKLQEPLCKNQEKIIISVNDELLELIVTTEIDSKRIFGGTFVKIGINGSDQIWVSSTLNEQNLKDIIYKYFKVSRDSLYRYY